MSKHYAKVTDVGGEDHVDRVYSDAMEPADTVNDVLIKDNADRRPDGYGIIKAVDNMNLFRRYKITGAGPVYIMTERTDTEIRSTQEHTDAMATRIAISGGTHLTYKGTTSSLTYEDTGSLTFAGSNLLGAILAVKILFKQAGSASTSSVRLYDVTNSQVICEITGLASEGKIVKDMGTISNVPTGEAILELQAKVGDVVDTAKTFELHIAH